jgi:hypothetical protein
MVCVCGRRPCHGSSGPFTAEARVRTQVGVCGIYSGHSDTGTGFSHSSSSLPCQYHSTMALHAYILPGGWTISPFVVAVQRHSLTPPTRTWTWTECGRKYLSCAVQRERCTLEWRVGCGLQTCAWGRHTTSSHALSFKTVWWHSRSCMTSRITDRGEGVSLECENTGCHVDGLEEPYGTCCRRRKPRLQGCVLPPSWRWWLTNNFLKFCVVIPVVCQCFRGTTTSILHKKYNPSPLQWSFAL